MGTVENRDEDLAFQVIANILFNSDASPLKNAIVSSGLGKDFGGLCMSGTTPKTIMLTYLVEPMPDRQRNFSPCTGNA